MYYIVYVVAVTFLLKNISSAVIPLDFNITSNEVYDKEQWQVDVTEVANERSLDNEIKSYLYKTAKNYYCSVKQFDHPEVLLYASKSWTFPKQDVNLTLQFPGPNDDYYENSVITGFRVTLYQDGKESRGFVNSGGMMQTHLSISFVCSDITVLGYQFWVFGVSRTEAEANGAMLSFEELC